MGHLLEAEMGFGDQRNPIDFNHRQGTHMNNKVLLEELGFENDLLEAAPEDLGDWFLACLSNVMFESSGVFKKWLKDMFDWCNTNHYTPETELLWYKDSGNRNNLWEKGWSWW